jgi:KUP system potassium uptake protein
VSASKSSLAALTLGAIGVVYGDIGTSVLYAIKVVFETGHVPLTPQNIYGILSIFFWTLTVIVSIKYVVLVLRADNNGEGGLVAMLALASQAVKDKPKLRRILLIVGIFGTSLFYGDGVITPAISVLSAVEGLEVVSPAFVRFVVPITLVVLFGLFIVQKRGTGGIGKFFGPITLVWFFVIALLGVLQIMSNPAILWAISPHYAVGFMWANPVITFLILGAVVLCVTGAEALYADLGHFGKMPIRLAWFSVVMPALTLNYFGQGALLLKNPAAVKNPFFLMAPEWALIPLVLLATMATVIASQALITGDQTGDSAGLFAALEHHPHQRARHRANLHSAGQLGPVCHHCSGRGAVPLVGQPGGGVWHCGVYRHAHHHRVDLLRDSLQMEVPPGVVFCRHRLVFHSGFHVFCLQPAQAV